MNSQLRFSETCSASRMLVLALGPWLIAGAAVGAPPEKQLYYNQDCTEFFAAREIPDGKAGETIDRQRGRSGPARPAGRGEHEAVDRIREGKARAGSA